MNRTHANTLLTVRNRCEGDQILPCCLRMSGKHCGCILATFARYRSNAVCILCILLHKTPLFYYDYQIQIII